MSKSDVRKRANDLADTIECLRGCHIAPNAILFIETALLAERQKALREAAEIPIKFIGEYCQKYHAHNPTHCEDYSCSNLKTISAKILFLIPDAEKK